MTTWTDLQRALAPAKKPIEDGVAHAPEATRELQRTLLELLARPTPPTADVALYGAMLALFGPRPTYRHPSRVIEVARFTASVGGGGFLVDVVMASRAWSQSSAASVGIYTQELSWIEPTTDPNDDHPWLALREVLREDPTLRDEATKRARVHLAEHGRHTEVHWALAAALPFADDLLTDDDLRHALRGAADLRATVSLVSMRRLRRSCCAPLQPLFLRPRITNQDAAPHPSPPPAAADFGDVRLCPAARGASPAAAGPERPGTITSDAHCSRPRTCSSTHMRKTRQSTPTRARSRRKSSLQAECLQTRSRTNRERPLLRLCK